MLHGCWLLIAHHSLSIQWIVSRTKIQLLPVLCVCLPTMCSVAKWMIGSGCHLGGEWGQSRIGVFDGVHVPQGEGALSVVFRPL